MAALSVMDEGVMEYMQQNEGVTDVAKTPQEPRLMDEVRRKIRLKHYSLRTEQAYTAWVRRFILTNDKGVTVNRWESYFHLGTSQMDNEECAVTHQMFRALGGVHIDHQARV